MDQRRIPYRTRPEQAGANARLAGAVDAELHRTSPEGVSYATFRLDDQVTFVHLVQVRTEPSPLLAVRAFGKFQAGIGGRVDTGPGTGNLTEVGSCRFFAG